MSIYKIPIDLIKRQILKKLRFNVIKSGLYKKYRLLSAKIAAALINSFKVIHGDLIDYEYYDLWKKNGFYIVPDHYYYPVPSISKSERKVFDNESELVGIDLNIPQQIKLLQEVFSKYKNEYREFLKKAKKLEDFHLGNLAFDGVDALAYYGLIRHLQPKLVMEVGSGWSTKIAAKAMLTNGHKNVQLVSIEPYPQEILKKGFPGLTDLISKRIEDVPLEYFDKLGEGDIFFIDSSHVIKTGGDVNYLILEILPRLKKGVFIHIHDIFLPFEYPETWVTQEHRYWSEQYLVHAFLAFNDHFKVIYSSRFMGTKFSKEVKKAFPCSPFFNGGSFWIKKVK